MNLTTESQEKSLTSIFIGTGGTKPGLTVRDDEYACNRPIRHHRLDGSVYTGDVDIDSCRIVAGTKHGSIYLLSVSGDNDDPSINVNRAFYQSAPVLSVCFVGRNSLASTDAAGRCLLWQPHSAPDTPDRLAATRGIIYSLCRIDNDMIVGLSSQDQLLFWDVSNKKLIQVISCPGSGKWRVLPQLKHWKAKNTLVWPVDDGRLAACQLDSFEINTYQGHRRQFSTIIIDGDELITIGTYDGLVKRWSDLGRDPGTCCACPEGIVTGGIYGNTSEEKQFLLIDGAGEAVIYTFARDTAKPIAVLPGCYYRAIIAPSEYALATFLTTRRRKTAKNIQREAEGIISTEPSESIDRHCDELEKLGFTPVSLGLQARAAAGRQDILQELKAYTQLAALLSYDDTRCFEYFRKYIDVLIRTWQIDLAARNIMQLPQELLSTSISCWVSETHQIQAEGNWLTESEFPLPTLIEAAGITGRKFTGRWVIEPAEPVKLTEKGVTALLLADKYQSLRQENNQLDIDSARVLTLWKLSVGKPAQNIEMVYFSSGEREIPAIYPAVQIIHDPNDDMIVPIMIFDAGNTDIAIDTEEHNRQLLDLYHSTATNPTITYWPDDVRRLIIQAIGLLTNQLHWNRKNSGVVKDESQRQ